MGKRPKFLHFISFFLKLFPDSYERRRAQSWGSERKGGPSTSDKPSSLVPWAFSSHKSDTDNIEIDWRCPVSRI